jgi:hypothetical protein
MRQQGNGTPLPISLNAMYELFSLCLSLCLCLSLSLSILVFFLYFYALHFVLIILRGFSLAKFARGSINSYKEEVQKAVEEDPNFWLKRPLTKTMTEYAREDVLNLPFVYRQLKAPLLLHNYNLVLLHSRTYLDQLRYSSRHLVSYLPLDIFITCSKILQKVGKYWRESVVYWRKYSKVRNCWMG